MTPVKPPQGKRKPVVISEYLTEINKASGKPVTLKPKPKMITVNADHRINIP